MDKLTKLSQAIRLGASFRPQCFGSYFEQGNSCALGAAYEACTGISERDGAKENPMCFLQNRFSVPRFTLKAAATMNDDGQTRENVAEWLERQGL